MATAILSAARLREVIHYEPTSGVFTRKVRLAQRHQAGDRADTEITSPRMLGYRRVSLFSQRYLAHRVAWLYVHGVWPEKHIDHINGEKGDNRIANLREADDQLNLENVRRPRSGSKTGFLGVYFHKQNKNYIARIQVHGQTRHIGVFDTPEEAHQAYLVVKRKSHEGCTI